MNQMDAQVFVHLAHRVFFIRDDGYKGKDIYTLVKGGEPSWFSEGAKTIRDIEQFCALLNRQYQAVREGTFEEGGYYAKERKLRFCKRPNYPSDSDEVVMGGFTNPTSNVDVQKMADALNKARELALEEKEPVA